MLTLLLTQISVHTNDTIACTSMNRAATREWFIARVAELSTFGKKRVQNVSRISPLETRRAKDEFTQIL